jgi:hypothetical protein
MISHENCNAKIMQHALHFVKHQNDALDHPSGGSVASLWTCVGSYEKEGDSKLPSFRRIQAKVGGRGQQRAAVAHKLLGDDFDEALGATGDARHKKTRDEKELRIRLEQNHRCHLRFRNIAPDFTSRR